MPFWHYNPSCTCVDECCLNILLNSRMVTLHNFCHAIPLRQESIWWKLLHSKLINSNPSSKKKHFLVKTPRADKQEKKISYKSETKMQNIKNIFENFVCHQSNYFQASGWQTQIHSHHKLVPCFSAYFLLCLYSVLHLSEKYQDHWWKIKFHKVLSKLPAISQKIEYPDSMVK